MCYSTNNSSRSGCGCNNRCGSRNSGFCCNSPACCNNSTRGCSCGSDSRGGNMPYYINPCGWYEQCDTGVLAIVVLSDCCGCNNF